MGRYLIRRTLFLILVLFIISLLTFVIFLKLPAGDPARRAAGRRVTPQILRQVRQHPQQEQEGQCPRPDNRVPTS